MVKVAVETVGFPYLSRISMATTVLVGTPSSYWMVVPATRRRGGLYQPI